MLDVSYHVSQYQNIISELRGEIGRLKEKIQAEGVEAAAQGGGRRHKQVEELKDLRDEMVANFREQMKLRWRTCCKTLHMFFLPFPSTKNQPPSKE